MENILQYIPQVISAILLAALILTVITNIITQVVKKVTWDKIPTNILAVVVSMAVTLLAFFAVCQIMGWAVTWYMVAGAVALGLFVSYAAMFGFDKLREALEPALTNSGRPWSRSPTGAKTKRSKEDPRHRVGAGGSLFGSKIIRHIRRKNLAIKSQLFQFEKRTMLITSVHIRRFAEQTT